MTDRNGGNPEVLRPDVAARTSRHVAHVKAHVLAGMRVADPFELDDEVLDGCESAPCSPMRSKRHSHRTEHPKGKLEPTANGVGKVWKLPFWKRRSSLRSKRAALSSEWSQES